MKLDFVLIDYENIQPKNLDMLRGRPVRIKVFLGSHQTRIPLEMAQALQAFGAEAEYVATEGTGNNALDFHIAYYIGRLAAEYPGATFHIVSKDTGFDPLVRHLRKNGTSCQRTADLSEFATAHYAESSPDADKIKAVIDNLAKRNGTKPRTLKALRTIIQSLFVNRLANEELDNLIGKLTERGTLTVTAGKVHYSPHRSSHA